MRAASMTRATVVRVASGLSPSVDRRTRSLMVRGCRAVRDVDGRGFEVIGRSIVLGSGP